METCIVTETKQQIKVKLYADDIMRLKEVLACIPGPEKNDPPYLPKSVIMRIPQQGDPAQGFEEIRMMDCDSISIIFQREFTDQEGGW